MYGWNRVLSPGARQTVELKSATVSTPDQRDFCRIRVDFPDRKPARGGAAHPFSHIRDRIMVLQAHTSPTPQLHAVPLDFKQAYKMPGLSKMATS